MNPTLGKDDQPLMFFYLRINNWSAGSVYKYHTLLLARYGGLLIGRESKNVITKMITRYQPDLIFCHGDWLLDYQIPLGLKIPYLLFEHDIHSLRTKLNNRQLSQEQEMLENAGGIIFTSEDHQDHCNKHFDITCNQGIVHLRPLRQSLAWEPLQKLPGKHLVYAGGLTTTAGGNYGYRSYHKIFEAFIKAGWEVHVYPANTYATATAKSYTRIGCHVYKNITYNSLLQQMSQYTAGLQSYNKENTLEKAFAYTQTCRPNKVWDYLAAGIPTIGLNPGNCAKIYQEGGWGVVLPDVKPTSLESIELPTISDSLRFKQVMENDLSVFEKVIGGVLSPKTKTKKKVTREEEDDMADAKHLWYRLTKPVVEDGKLLHGRGKRIPMNEAIRLGLVKKEVLVKDTLKKRAEKKKDKKKVTKKIETKPLVDEGGTLKKSEEEATPEKKREVKKLTHKLSLEVINKKEKEGEN